MNLIKHFIKFVFFVTFALILMATTHSPSKFKSAFGPNLYKKYSKKLSFDDVHKYVEKNSIDVIKISELQATATHDQKKSSDLENKLAKMNILEVKLLERYWDVIRNGKNATTKSLLNTTSLQLETGSLWTSPPENFEAAINYDRVLSQIVWMMEAGLNPRLKNLSMKKILINDGFQWWGKKWKSPHQLSNCPGGFDRCEFYDRVAETKMDASINVRDSGHTINKYRKNGKLRFVFIAESPFFSQIRLEEKYDLLASYHRGSHVVSPYEKWLPYNSSVLVGKQEIDYSKGKKKTGAAFISNCFSKNGRLHYLKKLKKYIDINVYGTCGHHSCSRKWKKKCMNLLRTDYFFYFAFENANCRDYITEKLFINALQSNVVPVVLGAHPDDYKAAAPHHSYIHADAFETPKALAEYLLYLKDNPDLYNEYFRWKKTGEFISTEFFCRVCALVHYADIESIPERERPITWKHNAKNLYYTANFRVSNDSRHHTNLCMKPGAWHWK